MTEYNRISGRIGNIINLDAMFYHNGLLADPYAIRRIDIYKTAVKDENLVTQIIIPLPTDLAYPYPISRVTESGTIQPGKYVLQFLIPTDYANPDIYFDVWRFVGDEGDVTVGAEDEDESKWISQCNRFWVYPDNWYVDDGLITFRIGFEALDKVFKKPEIRNLEVGLMPLPLYDYDYNRITPLIPLLQAFIQIETENGEVIVSGTPKIGCDGQPCIGSGSDGGYDVEGRAKIGLRQGSYRTNPYVVQYLINTSRFLIGSYKYRIILLLPNGETRVSDDMHFSVI